MTVALFESIGLPDKVAVRYSELLSWDGVETQEPVVDAEAVVLPEAPHLLALKSSMAYVKTSVAVSARFSYCICILTSLI